jgi:rod shape-determining protein MreC
VLNFLRRNRLLLASGFCLVLAVGLVMTTGRERGRGDILARMLLEGLAPLQRATASVGAVFSRTWRGIGDVFRARTENIELRTQVRGLQEKLDTLTEIEIENARLRRLLDFREKLVGSLVTARVIGYDAAGLARTLVIDRGESDGVVKGAAVLVPEGVVGQVFVVSSNAARVLLVSDHNSGVDAVVQRSRVRGIVQGTPEGGCQLKYVKRTDDLQVGDTLVTSGLDGIFPKGLPIGEIASIDRRGQGLFQAAEVRPRFAQRDLEEVLVTRGPVTPAEPPDVLARPPA